MLISRVYDEIMKRLQEKASDVSGLKKLLVDWAKKKGKKGSTRMMEK